MEKSYTPFPALVAIVGALVIYFVFDLVLSLRQRATQQQQLAAIERVLPEANRLNQTMVGLSRDLLALSNTSPSAKKLVEDFKIQAVRQQNAPAPKK